MRAWFSQFLGRLRPTDTPVLQVRLYRLCCATTCGLCLGIIFPANLQQNLPLGVNLGVVILGLAAGGCYWASIRGRHFYRLFFALLLVLTDPIWFLNAGSVGSVTYYFFPLLFYPLAVFRGRLRWVLAVVVLLNVYGLLLVEYHFPGLIVPFQQPRDRLIDLVTGTGCSLLALGVLVWLMVSAYEDEESRISRYADDLATGEENYRAIFNSTSDALFVYSEDGRLIDVNTRMSLMFGCDRAQALGQSINERSLGVSPYTQAEADEKMRRALREGPQVFLWRSRRANGELFWSEVALRAAEIAGRRRVIAAVRDISLRVEAAEALRTQEERLRLALAASDQGWFDLNVQTGEGTASGEYARIIGLDPAEFMVTAQAWMEGIHPEDREMMAREFQACILHGGTRTMEYRRQTKSGDWKWIRSTGKIVERDADGRARRMTGTHADITERKKLEARLLHSQRLESVGTLAGGVAHDLNNILTPMLMVGGVLGPKLADPEDRALLASIEAGAKRGAAIVRQLLTFSRDLAQTRSSVDVARLLREMMDIMGATFPREIRLVARVPESLWPVSADPIQLHQVLMNLCINARDAMPAGGTLTLVAENLSAAGERLPDEPGRSIRLTVSDTGVGIPAEHLGRVFDPFFTTKGVGKGTGLGLSMVHGIVKGHGGTVAVESEVGRGTSFHVILPASATLPAPPVAADASPRPGAGRPLVLVVDDEPSVLALTARVLEHEGYEVLAAAGGDEAFALFQRRPAEVKLAITDLMMPGLDGMKLAVRLRQVRPDLKVIGVSGLDYERGKAERPDLGFVEVLRKPYDGAVLLAAVHRQLPG